MQLITEYLDNTLEYITEAGAGGKKNVFIEGVFMQAGVENRNRRIYSESVLHSAVDKYITEQVQTNRAVGELNHPATPSINLDKVSHRITELRWEGNDVIGKALVLDTPMGKIVKNLIEGGVKLGVSSRGMGSVSRNGATSHVDSGFLLSTVDIVQDPSAPSAFVNGIMEGVEFYPNGKGGFSQKKSDPIAEMKAFEQFLKTL